ncbi:acetyl/propionyl/methylcrotonyl-CoA carboxylase subunit alpha [Saccharopolyspora sp. ASAGF58]|uniref:acetyl-CoA carboxylase biotin carboxylase subunit n=1 Tax=Saccharopolyspora sp. ASAGF58 TaxID=2719023 RepID=UPI0014401CA7|nr:biotin carboxylase N-terminal domain-containing protein [Saccharopolyspora sp. ASAGF58]QIZ37731.1 ATP-grasp domain-containing protein [Saccharopolyspora sp. ASAGF58]
MRSLLIANRGEIAVRIVRACFDEGIESVLVVSAADTDSLAARLADRVVVIGPASASESYLSVHRVVAAALYAGCDALHPGYGFLSERPELVDACEENKITYVGPPADIMRRSGSKLGAREVAEKAGIPTGKGTPGLRDVEDAVRAAEALDNFPLLLKASAGGGGRGMTIVRDVADLREGFARSSTEAERAFGDGTVYLEPYIEKARHVEVQILADTHGNVCHLGERDCSTQRRYQKIIEEAPGAGLPEELAEAIRTSAVELCRALGYVGAGTVEFLVDAKTHRYVFLEVNARVQVEHPITEMVTGVDIVREQLRIARGEPLSFRQEDVRLAGHAIECRINAEDPRSDFRPTPGRIEKWTVPQGAGVRVDTYAHDGAVVAPWYDSLVAKVIVHAADRPAAVDLMRRTLERTRAEGISTTVGVHRAILGDPAFAQGPVTTRWLEEQFLPSWLED